MATGIDDYKAYAVEQAVKNHIDPGVYSRLINQESGWNPNAVSSSGAFGLTQFLPSTAKDPGYGVEPFQNTGDPYEQISKGAEYFGAFVQKYGGNTAKALAAYNAGPGVADKWDGKNMDYLPSETRNYINSIMGLGGTGEGGSAAPYGSSDTDPSSGGFSMGKDAPEPYKPDALDNIYGKLQGSDFGQMLGLKEDGFQKGGFGRTVVGAALSGFGMME